MKRWGRCGPGGGHHHGPEHRGEEGSEGDWGEGDWGERGGDFGVRRPLRFLAHKLQLDEGQIAELARILNDLKTERAQAAVDDRRSVAAFADALAGEAFDSARAGQAAQARVQSAERLRDAVLKALGQVHALLKPEQRVRLAYLIRTGRLVV